jgi:colanic acid/amylovoran biosynthesis protein
MPVTSRTEDSRPSPHSNAVTSTASQTTNSQTSTPPVILMGAALDTGNRGVSALGTSLTWLVKQNKPASQVNLLLSRRTSEPYTLRGQGKTIQVGVLNYRWAPRARLRESVFLWFAMACLYRAIPIRPWRSFLRSRLPLIGATASASFIGDIRGGDSFSDIYGLGNFVRGSLPVISVLLVRGRIALLPQTYGPYKSPWARAIARFILRRAEAIVSRDRESLATIKGLIGECPRTQFCPDVAFSLESIRPDKIQLEPPLPQDRPARLVGLNVNGLMFHGGYNRANMFGLSLDYHDFLKRLLAAWLKDPKTHVLLVPHTFAPAGRVESDPEACRVVLSSLDPSVANRVHLVTREYDQNEIKGVIGLCDFFVGSRMHACIAALSQGIPAVGIAYSKKFRGVFETVGMEDWVIDGRDADAESALRRVLALDQECDAVRPKLKQRVEEAQQTLRVTFRNLLS